MRTRRTFLIALFGMPLFGDVGTLWRKFSSTKFASILGLRAGADAGQTVTAIIDVMFPGDAAPGAMSLGIADSIRANANVEAVAADGAAWLDHWALAQGVVDFMSLDQNGKQHALEAALASDDDGASQLVSLIRFYAGLAYYSEPSVKATFPYTGPPQPNGFGDFAGPPQ
jgi:hypothetical protein